jgi:hypothetical protein
MKTSNHSTRKVSIGSNYPQAWLTVTKNRQKVYNSNQIFLRDDQEFEIEIFNPTSTTYLAKVRLNGNYISSRGLIVYPGQRVFLDRFIDENAKFSFSTYEVDDVKEVRKAIEKNGLVDVEFFAEQTIFSNQFNTGNSGTATWKNPYYYPNGNWLNPGGSFTTTNGNNLMGSVTNTASYYSGETLFSSSVSDSNFSKETKSLETGRVEKGGRSEQNFEETTGNFSSFYSYISSFHILPVSTKPVEASEIRNYCSSCGLRVKKQNWQFCPKCGNKL